MKKKRNRALKRIDRLRDKVEENHTALARGKFVGQYQPKYSIEDMDTETTGDAHVDLWCLKV
jgi:hypothetical protein